MDPIPNLILKTCRRPVNSLSDEDGTILDGDAIYPYQSVSNMCLHDEHPFDGPSVSLPVHYDQHKREYSTIYTFCSFACAKRFAMDSAHINRQVTMPLLAQMALEVSM